MTTITDIRNDLIKVFNGLRDGTIEAKDAMEINNTAGKIISSAKVQLAHAALRGEKPNIPFLMGEVEAVAIPGPAQDQLPSIRKNAVLEGQFPSGSFQKGVLGNEGAKYGTDGGKK